MDVKTTIEFPTDLSGLVESALNLADQQEQLIEQIRLALKDGNDAEMKRLVILLCEG